MRRKLLVIFVLVMMFIHVHSFAAQIYTVDVVHSAVNFKVRHLGISSVPGKFDTFSGQLSFEGDTLTAIEGKIEASSINTGDKSRDNHLKADDFFSAEKFPLIVFKSTKITQNGNDVSVIGDLTMRGITKTIELKGNLGGFVKMGNVKKTGLAMEGEINRQDFGLSFNKLLETGQLAVGNEVKIFLELEANL